MTSMTRLARSSGAKAVKLSIRETEVLSLIARGNTSKEVAEALFLSKRTVDFHLCNVYEKLEVDNRIQAFRKAAQLGLIPQMPSFDHSPV